MIAAKTVSIRAKKRAMAEEKYEHSVHISSADSTDILTVEISTL
jgi:hypothetical protein